MQRMSENFIDAFGFQDAAFNDDGEDDNTEMNTLTNALSSDSDQAGQTNPSEASKRSQGIFESICEQRFTSFPGGFDGDEENNEMNQEEVIIIIVSVSGIWNYFFPSNGTTFVYHL